MKLQATCNEFLCLTFKLILLVNLKHLITKYNLLTISQICEPELTVLMYRYHKNTTKHIQREPFSNQNQK